MGNTQTDEIEKNAANIISILKEVKYNRPKRAKEIVELLEDRDFLAEEFLLNQIGTKQHKNIELRYQAFCNAYLMKLFLEFITDEHGAEIMLMRYGYLRDFTDKKMGIRYERYWEHAHTYNEHISDKERGEKGNLLREAEKSIVKEFAETLAGIMLNSNGKLNFAEDVLNEFSNNAIPEKLSLPITEYFKHAYIQPKEQTEEDNGQNVKLDMPDTDDGDKMAASSDGNPEQGKISVPPKNSEPDNEQPTEKAESINKIVKAVYFAGALIAGSIIAGSIILGIIKPLVIEKTNTREAAVAPAAPAESLSSARGIPVDEALRIEAESFNIADENKNIQVVPNIPRKLDIELNPQNADISTLEFESSSPDIVGVEYGYVTASDVLMAGQIYIVDITITARKTGYKDTVHITVENPVIPDDAEGPVGSGE